MLKSEASFKTLCDHATAGASAAPAPDVVSARMPKVLHVLPYLILLSPHGGPHGGGVVTHRFKSVIFNTKLQM